MESAESSAGFVMTKLLLVVDDGALAFVMMTKSMHSGSRSLERIQETFTVLLLKYIPISMKGTFIVVLIHFSGCLFTLDKTKRSV